VAILADDNGTGREDSLAAAARQYVDRSVKCLISLGFWGASELGRCVLRAAGRHVPAMSIVIYYHRVQRHERARFARQLDYLRKWTTPIRADIDEQLPNGARYVAVTFDDGWSSFANIAAPELLERKIPVTLFAIAGCLDGSLRNTSSEPLISEAQLSALATQGVTIGSHTLTHSPLTKVDEATALYELIESRRRLSILLGREVNLFSFPFSLSNARLVELCAKAGYQRVFTGLPYVAFARPGEFETGRIRVDPTDWPLEFRLKLMGAYRWLPAAFALKHWLRERARHLFERIRSRTTIPAREAT
jgi:peptidoglycan/xylan/chitin deacetylase (PgdA/CDA1 family)